MIRYSRPINASKHLIKELKKELDAHLPSIHLNKKFQIGNLDIELFPSSTKLGSAYCMGVEVDRNSGGFLVSNMYKNLELVIKEKHEEVKLEHNKYACWWLILVDYISYGLASYDLKQLNSLSPFNRCFDKILLLSPEDISHVSEVKL
jgi:hypothetical protein